MGTYTLPVPTDELKARRDRLRWVTAELREAERDVERLRCEQATALISLSRLVDRDGR